MDYAKKHPKQKKVHNPTGDKEFKEGHTYDFDVQGSGFDSSTTVELSSTDGKYTWDPPKPPVTYVNDAKLRVKSKLVKGDQEATKGIGQLTIVVSNGTGPGESNTMDFTPTEIDYTMT